MNMLVSHRHRFIFLKTKKTAGTSIEIYFEPYCMGPGEWSGNRGKEARPEYCSEYGIIGQRGISRTDSTRWWNHMPAGRIRDGIGPDLWSKYFRFATIRNPFEKAISAYFFYKKRHKLANLDPSAEQQAFQSWLENVGPPIDRNKYLLRGEYCLSDVIRSESILADLERVCGKVGVPFEPERLKRFKSGIRPDWAKLHLMYTPHSRSIIENLYAFELEFFGYGYPEQT